MAKKKEMTEEAETVLVFSEKIETISDNFGREDLNKMRDVLNMLVERVNNA